MWLSAAGYALGDTGPAGGFIFYENPNYAADGWRYLEAAPFDQSAGADVLLWADNHLEISSQGMRSLTRHSREDMR